MKTIIKSLPKVYNRCDAVGNKKADTGSELFAVGKEGNSLTFTNLLEDIKNIGYSLTEVYLLQKNKDYMAFIVFVFENKTNSNDFPIEIYSLLTRLCNITWQHVHIWDNPDGSITINSAHIF